MREGELTPQDVRAALGEVGARAANLGTGSGDKMAKRALLMVGKLDAMMLLEGALAGEFKAMCETVGTLMHRVKCEEKKHR